MNKERKIEKVKHDDEMNEGNCIQRNVGPI